MTDSNLPTSQIQAIDFPAVADARAVTSEGTTVRSDAAFLKDVHVLLEAHLGSTEMSVRDLLALKSGSVVPLTQQLGDMVELRLNASTVARGELVAVGNQFGVRIKEINELG